MPYQYQYLASSPQSRSPLARPQPVYSPRHARPPTHPPPLVPPQSSSVIEAPRLKHSANTNSDQLHPSPYPYAISPGYQTPHPNITVEPISTAHIPSLTRITGLLLPVRYPNSFFTATVTDPVVASVSRVAIYHDHHHQHSVSPATTATSLPTGANTGTDKVIGGIRCRLERLPQTTTELLNSQSKSQQEPANLYIQTLHLLSPYRGHGVATSLLNALLFDSTPQLGASGCDYQVSELVKHYNVRTVTAHVHEANDAALHWYRARGFNIEDGVVENYYRRLYPSGAKIVKLVLRWNEPPSDLPASSGSQESKARNENEDDDWEKVEAEDDEDENDHGVQLLSGSGVISADDGSRKKRKTDGDDEGRLV